MKTSQFYQEKLNRLHPSAPATLRASLVFLRNAASVKQGNFQQSSLSDSSRVQYIDNLDCFQHDLGYFFDTYYSSSKFFKLSQLAHRLNKPVYALLPAFLSLREVEKLVNTPDPSKIQEFILSRCAGKFYRSPDKSVSILCLHKADAGNPYYSQFSLLSQFDIPIYFEHRPSKWLEHVRAQHAKGIRVIVFLHQLEPFLAKPEAESAENKLIIQELASTSDLVFFWHNEISHTAGIFEKVYPYQLYLASIAKLVVVHSAAGLNQLARYVKNNILNIAHPAILPLDAFLSSPYDSFRRLRSYGLEYKKYFLVSGSISEYKNVLSVIDAWLSLPASQINGWHLVVAGKNELPEHLRQLFAEKLKASKSVVYIEGRIDDSLLYPLMAGAYMGVCAYSRIWSSGIACSYKTLLVPVIYSRTTGLDEYFSNGIDGIQCDSPSSVEIAKSFERALEVDGCVYDSMRSYLHFWKLDNNPIAYLFKILDRCTDSPAYLLDVNEVFAEV